MPGEDGRQAGHLEPWGGVLVQCHDCGTVRCSANCGLFFGPGQAPENPTWQTIWEWLQSDPGEVGERVRASDHAAAAQVAAQKEVAQKEAEVQAAAEEAQVAAQKAADVQVAAEKVAAREVQKAARKAAAEKAAGVGWA